MSQRSAPKQVIVNALGARYLATPQKAEDMIQEMVENGSLRPDSFGGYILIGPAIMEIAHSNGLNNMVAIIIRLNLSLSISLVPSLTLLLHHNPNYYPLSQHLNIHLNIQLNLSPTPYTPIHPNSTDVSRSSSEVICFKVEFIAALRRAFRIDHFDAEIRFRKLKDAGDIRCDESSRIVTLVRESAKNMWAEYGEWGLRR
ncbi:hypothetical protein ACEPPN_003741 [Leptodophora sp. 'Broadleaf-Isolate-01']